MTVDDALDLAADHLDAVIAKDVRTFGVALLDDGVAGEVADEALAWRREALWLWKLETLDALASWFRLRPAYDVH